MAKEAAIPLREIALEPAIGATQSFGAVGGVSDTELSHL